MAVNLASLKAEAEAVVNEATTIADLADTWAKRLRPLIAGLPTVGPEVDAIVAVIDGLDKALHEAKSVLSSL
jgi:hypothetical protein